uniref:Cytochrome P450 n=1 Tax=Timema tahoe TaxID=61484 RepID=A0A7R9IP44_9NEOP|nr:unnamed protein product [Timema tahoe]
MFRFQIVPAYFWRKIHEDYIVVTNMVVTFNCAVSKIVLISIGNNMYFTCYQLYGGLQSNGDLIGKIFFHLSFLFMAGKLFTSLSYLSQVHNEASQPRFVLSSVPQQSYCPERRHIRELASKIPGPKAYPLIGNILDVLASTQEESVQKYLRVARKYFPTARIWAGPYLFIFVSDPCDLEILMNSEKCIERERFKNIAEIYPLGDGLIAIGGEQWKIHRKFILSSFHYRHFEYFVKIFNKKSSILVNCLKHDPNTVTSINILHYFTRAAFDSICETIIGVEMNSQDKGSDKFIDSMQTYLGIGTQMFLKPYLLNLCLKHDPNTATSMAVLYGVMSFNKVLFLNLAKEWPNISAIWSRMESSLGHYGYPRGLDTRMNFMTCFWFGSLMVEYACWIVFSFLKVPDTYPNTPLGLIRGFSETTYGFVYHFIEYSDCAGVTIFIVDLLGTLNIVVPDVFLILCCMSLTERFKQINRSLETVRGKVGGAERSGVGQSRSGKSLRFVEVGASTLRSTWNSSSSGIFECPRRGLLSTTTCILDQNGGDGTKSRRVSQWTDLFFQTTRRVTVDIPLLPNYAPRPTDLLSLLQLPDSPKLTSRQGRKEWGNMRTGKPLSVHPTGIRPRPGSDPDLSVFGSIVQHENSALEHAATKWIVPAYFWRKIHEDYIVVTNMVVTFNCAVSKIVLISIGNNMYFTCYQLYGGLQSNGDLISKIFFHLSFLFMAGKLFTSLSYISQVHNEASQPSMNELPASVVEWSRRHSCVKTGLLMTGRSMARIPAGSTERFSLAEPLLSPPLR